MRLIKQIDHLVIGGVQACVNTFEWQYDVKYYKQARILAIATAGIFFACLYSLFLTMFTYGAVGWSSYKYIVTLPAPLVLLLFHFKLIAGAEYSTSNGFKNPYRSSDWFSFLRVCHVALGVGLIGAYWFYSHAVLLVVIPVLLVFLVASCEDAPPQRRLAKIRLY